MKKSSYVFLFSIVFFLSSCYKEKIKLGIQPFGNFNSSLTDTIVYKIQQTYDTEVYILKEINLPQAAFIQIKVPRYRADSLLLFLKRDKPDFVNYVMGLTNQDISFTKKGKDGDIKKPTSLYSDWGIFGLGYVPGSCCVISSHRLQHPNQAVFISRLKKVAIHELGHNLGLPHCEPKGCVMQDAVETIKTIDAANDYLCNECKEELD